MTMQRSSWARTDCRRTASAVIVNGEVAVRDGRETGIKVGLPIRYPVESNGRFVPLDRDTWESRHTVNVPHRHLDGGCVEEPNTR